MKPQNFLALLLLVLSACGFHLRGHQEVTSATASNVVLQSDSAPEVTAEVASLLKLGGANIVAVPDQAQYIVKIRNETFNREVLSVSAETGKVREYQLTLHAFMSVSGVKGELLVNDESVVVTRDYTFNDSSILGKSNEESMLRGGLVKQVSMQIVRRFNAVTK